MTIKEITTGQDAFLDIVANLVGVLIILVVVVGAQATAAYQPVTTTAADQANGVPTLASSNVLTTSISDLQSELAVAADHARKREIDNQILENQIQQEVSVNLRLSELRHQMLVQMKIVEQQLDEQKQQQRKNLSAIQAAELDLQEERRQLEIQLSEITAATQAVSAANHPKTETIEHYPNPIAKTVFAEEVHFQLRSGRLVYVPLEELVTRMKSEWKAAAKKLERAPRTVETVGPIQNFRLQYELEAESIPRSSAQGVVEHQTIRFLGFSLFPSSDRLGVPVSQAIDERSEFRQIINHYPPGKTTISLWIYPDSYTDYNDLKKWLYENGYQIACWPLDDNKYISGGPNGFRTSAQ